MTAVRVVAVLVLALFILFPGVELVRFVFSDLLGLYKDMSLTDCLLFFVILLLCALLLQRRTEEPRLRAIGHSVEERSSLTESAPRRPSSRSYRGSRSGAGRSGL